MDRKILHAHQHTKVSNPLQDSATLILFRVMGHKVDIPKSAQWQVITDTLNQQECWVCQLHKYTTFFWSQECLNTTSK
jgi:hypothetical protein